MWTEKVLCVLYALAAGEACYRGLVPRMVYWLCALGITLAVMKMGKN